MLISRLKSEVSETEERKNAQIEQMKRKHEKAFNDIKNYYNDITLNNLAMIRYELKKMGLAQTLVVLLFGQRHKICKSLASLIFFFSSFKYLERRNKGKGRQTGKK